ncbi:hypothetical protein CDL15_Pgr027349 [Punica granatum]|uniref:Uncharacterized protein n=1 Tax=Punica granatum TaxID=22663 RepID=A0A218Y2U2_PUNGR|nr:hypothetical protein CDL15_Pgr027349 [Punica granatum]
MTSDGGVHGLVAAGQRRKKKKHISLFRGWAFFSSDGVGAVKKEQEQSMEVADFRREEGKKKKRKGKEMEKGGQPIMGWPAIYSIYLG